MCTFSLCRRDYTRPDLPSGSEGELGGAAGGSNVPDLSAALAGEHTAQSCCCSTHSGWKLISAS